VLSEAKRFADAMISSGLDVLDVTREAGSQFKYHTSAGSFVVPCEVAQHREDEWPLWIDQMRKGGKKC
jgi:hypothetical protein